MAIVGEMGGVRGWGGWQCEGGVGVAGGGRQMGINARGRVSIFPWRTASPAPAAAAAHTPAGVDDSRQNPSIIRVHYIVIDVHAIAAAAAAAADHDTPDTSAAVIALMQPRVLYSALPICRYLFYVLFAR